MASRAAKQRSPLRVLIAKVGLDGHDRGVKIVARALRDAGVEVIYLGVHNTPEEIASSALQEDVDAVGLSIHSAAHLTLFAEVLRLLKKNKAGDTVVFGGGIVPQEDLRRLRKMGVKEIFTPGAPLEEIVHFVKSLPARKTRQKAVLRHCVPQNDIRNSRRGKNGFAQIAQRPPRKREGN